MKSAAAGDVGVTFGGTEAGVAEEGLDVADIGAAFEEVGGESMAETVNRSFFGDSGTADGVDKNVLGGADREMLDFVLTGEKPGLYIIKRTEFTDKDGGFFRKNSAPVFPAFTHLDINHLAGKINMFLFKRNQFADT